MSDCFVLYLLLICMKKEKTGAGKFTNNKMLLKVFYHTYRKLHIYFIPHTTVTLSVTSISSGLMSMS